MIPLGILASARVAAGSVATVDPATVSGALWSVQGADLTSGAISAWGSRFVQTDPEKQPTVDTLDGIKCAYFDGTEMLTNTGMYYLGTAQTMFAVVRPGFSTGHKYAIGLTSGSGVTLGVNNLKARQGAWGGDWAYDESADSAALNGWCVISGRYVPGTSFAARMNLDTPTTTATTTMATQDRRNQLGGNAGAVSWIGGIAEAWNFDAALSDDDWAGIVAHLMSKYALT